MNLQNFKNYVTSKAGSQNLNILRTEPVKIAYYGPSYSNTVDTQSPANSDISFASAPQPTVAPVNLTAPKYDKCAIRYTYPMAWPVQNCGISGVTLATMMTNEQVASSTTTRKAIDTQNQQPHVAIYVSAAVNDLRAATFIGDRISESAYQTILTNNKTCLMRLLAANSGVVVDFITYGYNDTFNGIRDGVRRMLRRLRDDMIAFHESLNIDRLYYVDPIGLVCDEKMAYLPNMTYDDVHLNILGAMKRDEPLKLILEANFGKSIDYFHQGKNLLTDPFWTNTQALVGGTWPASPYVAPTVTTGTATFSNANITVNNGKVWCYFDVTAGAVGDTLISLFMPYNPLASGTDPLNIAINDKYGFEGDISLEALSNGGVIYGFAQMEINVSTYGTSNNGNTRVIVDPRTDTPATSAMGYQGKIVNHVASPAIVYQEAAASYGTSSFIRYRIGFWQKNIGDVHRIGFSSFRTVKY